MSYILDTHALAWWLYKPGNLSNQTREILEDPDMQVFVSAISAYEVANKFRLGKWSEIGYLAKDFQNIVINQGFELLAVSTGDAMQAGLLDSDHRDPFDRIIAAQSIRGPFIVLTKDQRIAELGGITFW